MGTSISNPPSISGLYKNLGQHASTVNVAAGAVTNHVLIFVHASCIAGGSVTNGQATLDIYVGGVSKVTYTIWGESVGTSQAVSATHVLTYSPSAGEKSAGFAVTAGVTPGDAGRAGSIQFINVLGY
jgi:hypothetical protein